MINKLLQCPYTILQKPMFAMLVSIGFIVMGTVFGLTLDLSFLPMALILAVFSTYASIRLFRLALLEEYTVLEGQCSEIFRITFTGYLRITIDEAERGPVYIRLRKNIAARIITGGRYRFYFMGTGESGRPFDQNRFWAYEEMYQQK